MPALTVIIVGKYFLQQWVNLRQVARYSIKALPASMFYCRPFLAEFRAEQDSQYEKLTFEMLALSIQFGVEVLVMLGGIMPLVWDYSGTLPFIDPASEFQRGFVFVLFEAIRHKAFDVPIVLYDTLIIRPRHSPAPRLTMAQIFYDQLIECFSMLVSLPPLLYAYLWLTDRSGPFFYWAVGCIACGVAAFNSVCYPLLIHPLIYPSVELPATPLRDKIAALLAKHQFSITDISIIEGGKASCHAFITGVGRYSRMVIEQQAIRALDDEEVLAVIAH